MISQVSFKKKFKKLPLKNSKILQKTCLTFPFIFFILQQGSAKHKLQFLIGDNVLPYNMTVYQAIRQFSPLANDQSETDTDTETPIGKILKICI